MEISITGAEEGNTQESYFSCFLMFFHHIMRIFLGFYQMFSVSPALMSTISCFHNV